jgi:hypothetical protein
MSLNLVIAVTDSDWYDMLRQQPGLAEVNFWAPSAASFRALQPGEMFLFKLRAPRNVIVGGEHDARNRLLLRRDIHSLFDAGYVTVTPDLRFEVSRRIREEFDNGRHCYELHGKLIFAPADRLRSPDVEALRWHNEHAFRG